MQAEQLAAVLKQLEEQWYKCRQEALKKVLRQEPLRVGARQADGL